MTTRGELLQALASARTLREQVELAGELEAFDRARVTATRQERSLDWAQTTVGQTLRPVRVHERHTAATDWLNEMELGGDDTNRHQAVLAEAAAWFRRLHPAVKADAEEFVEQARGIARRTASRYGPAASESERTFLDYVAFLNRQVLAASGLDQVQQLVDSFENPKPTPLPQDVFDTFQPPIHPINQGVSGTEQSSLAPGAQEAMSEGGNAAGRPSEHEDEPEGYMGPQQGEFQPRSAGRKVAGALERAKDLTARRGHSMHWAKTQDVDGWYGECSGCSASIAVNASQGVVDGTATRVPCGNRTHASMGSGPSLAMGYHYNLGDFIRRQANGDFAKEADEDLSDMGETHEGSRGAGGAAPFVRESKSDPDKDRDDDSTRKGDTDDDYDDFNDMSSEAVRHTAPGGGEHAPYTIRKVDGGYAVFNAKGERKNSDPKSREAAREFQKALYANVPGASEEAAKKEAASGLDQIQQVTDSHDNPRPTSLPTEPMFPIVQPWPETTTESLVDQGGQDTGPTNRPRQASRKQADMFGGGDAPHPVPGGSPVTTPADNPPARPGNGFDKGFADGKNDSMTGNRPAFADNSTSASPYVKGYVEGFNSGVQQGGGAQDVPVSMGGDNGQAANSGRIMRDYQQPPTFAMRVSASLITRDVSKDEDFQRGYRYASTWKPGTDLVALGSNGEEAGIYAGITDNPAAQRAWRVAHQEMAGEYPELKERMASHRRVTASLSERNEDLLIGHGGLYVQAGTSLDLDTMSPLTSPDPQGSTPSEGPGSIPPLRDAPGTPAAPGGPSPYNGADPFGAPATPDPLVPGDKPVTTSTSPDALNMTGDDTMSGSVKMVGKTLAFRQAVQRNMLAMRGKKEN